MIRNFSPMNWSQAMVEAQRCLGCHEAPCQQACPARVDVPTFISRFREENLPGAAETIYDACPLGAICGQVCPTGDLCEKACVLTDLGQAPIRISALQAFITSQHQPAEKSPVATGRRVAVVGGGPAGLGCAVQLNRLGEEVHVFESGEESCGLVGRVIPAHRLPAEVVERDLLRLRASGVHFHANARVDGALAEKLAKEFDAVFLGTGQNGEVQPELPMEDIQGVHSALDFLTRARDGEIFSVGRRVVVVGAGNVAMDAAVVARQLGAEQVMVIYRRGQSEMPAWQSEYLEACQLGVEFRWLSVVERVHTEVWEGGELRVSGIDLARTRYSENKTNGRRGVEADPSQPVYTQLCDAIIFALGQALDERNDGLFGAATLKGLFAADPTSGQTADPRIFAGGEAVSGGSTVVASMSAGMAAGRSIHNFLSSEGRARL
ncbi:MAG: FAD-dependent oxidoreductase [Anaerolineaceae bacterium]